MTRRILGSGDHDGIVPCIRPLGQETLLALVAGAPCWVISGHGLTHLDALRVLPMWSTRPVSGYLGLVEYLERGQQGEQMHKSLHVALVPLTPAEVSVLFDWINDREQVLLNAPYKPVHAGQHQAWFEAIQQRNDAVIFGIRLTEAGRLIGSCQLQNIHPIHRSAELQIRLGAVAERGQGYGTEATRLLLDFAFKDLNLHRVYLHVLATNQIAVRMYEKVGFVREGVLREAAHIDGRYLDLIMMGILREEYVPA